MRLQVHRHDPDAVLAGALRDQLFEPTAEALELVIDEEGELVATGRRERPDGEAERDAGVGRRVGLAAGAEHRGRRGQERIEVQADERCRHEPDVRERRVAAADVRRVQEDLAEVVVVGERLDALARVRDGHDGRAAVVVRVVVLAGVHGGFGARPGVRQEGVRLGRRARLRGDDRQRRQRIEVVHDRAHVGRVGRVEDAQREIAVLGAERPVQDVRGEAAAAHARDDRGGEPRRHDPVAEPFEAGDPVREVVGRIQPAQPLRDGRLHAGIVRPQARVPIEQPVRPRLVPRPIARGVEGGLAVAEREPGRGDGGRGGVGHRGLRAGGGRVRSWYAASAAR